MKLTLDRDALAKAMTRLARVVERRSTIPILAHVALFTDESELRLKATNLDIEATDTVACETEEPGSITVQAHLLADIVKKLPTRARITLATAEYSRMTLQSGRSRFTLQTLPIDDFPDLAAGDFSHSFAMPRANLKRMFDKVEFAISTEETRYYLNGIYFHIAQGEDGLTLRGVATDGHRLAQCDTPLPEGAEGMPGVIIPRKTVAEIGKLIEDGEGDIGIELSAAKIRLTSGTVVLTSKLIDGTFPDYQRVIPGNNGNVLTVDRESFSAAVDRMGAVAVERGRAVKLAIGEGTVTLTIAHPEAGTATEEAEARYEGAPIEIGFNHRYLIDILAKVGTKQAVIKLENAGTPTIFQPTDNAETLFVLMPMRV